MVVTKKRSLPDQFRPLAHCVVRLCGIAFDHLGPSRVRLSLHVASVRLSDAGRLDLGAFDAGAGPPATR